MDLPGDPELVVRVLKPSTELHELGLDDAGSPDDAAIAAVSVER
jgi:hypothetical protein